MWILNTAQTREYKYVLLSSSAQFKYHVWKRTWTLEPGLTTDVENGMFYFEIESGIGDLISWTPAKNP